MKKPTALDDLLQELRDDGTIRRNPHVSPVTMANIYLDGIEESDETEAIQLNSEECALILANEDTVERLAEALNHPKNASIHVLDLVLSPRLIGYLEANQFTVDEI